MAASIIIWQQVLSSIAAALDADGGERAIHWQGSSRKFPPRRPERIDGRNFFMAVVRGDRIERHRRIVWKIASGVGGVFRRPRGGASPLACFP